MWLHATGAAPSRGTCSTPSNRQLNQNLMGGRSDHSAVRNQNSIPASSLVIGGFYPTPASGFLAPHRGTRQADAPPPDRSEGGRPMAAIILMLLIAVLFGARFAVKALLCALIV